MVTTKEINDFLNALPAKIAAEPLGRKCAWYTILLGLLLVIIGVITKIVF
ncbi:MAG: hypothetical protein Q7R76_01785 [Candidatus Woesearchaeota archaeon]|nr:hypothetical protein [Candidatus Woesearchaeota archaeon]